MKTATLISSALLLGATSILANTPIPEIDFAAAEGYLAAVAAAPMWHMPYGACMPSAAEDGHGHQTNGALADHCNIAKLNHNCPPQPKWQGINTHYGDVAGEPFATIPTYYNVQKCGNQWKIIYYVYFKKDTGHMSDWEGIVVSFTDQGDGNFYRDAVGMEQDGKHKWIQWGDVNDTFDSDDDWQNFQQKYKNHGKFYFGKFHHSVHQDWHSTFQSTCPPNSVNDYRNADYQWWSKDNLRHVSVLDPSWNWGQASSPAGADICGW